MKRLVVDLDHTLTDGKGPKGYTDAPVRADVVEKLRSYQADGFEIVVFTARNMRSYDGSVGKIQAFTLPLILDWLKANDIPYDEVITGKPWCGTEGFYVDDRAVRPSEFVNMTKEEIEDLLRDA